MKIADISRKYACKYACTADECGSLRPAGLVLTCDMPLLVHLAPPANTEVCWSVAR